MGNLPLWCRYQYHSGNSRSLIGPPPEHSRLSLQKPAVSGDR